MQRGRKRCAPREVAQGGDVVGGLEVAIGIPLRPADALERRTARMWGNWRVCAASTSIPGHAEENQYQTSQNANQTRQTLELNPMLD